MIVEKMLKLCETKLRRTSWMAIEEMVALSEELVEERSRETMSD